MNFAWPFVLWLLVIPLGLLAWDGARRRRVAKDGAPQKMLRGEAGARALTLASGPAPSTFLLRRRIWLGLGLVFAIVALARPQWGHEEEQAFDQSREILIAVDLSRSMLAPDVKPSRLERARLLIQSLLERLKGERVGLVVFSGTAFLQSPLSADYEILREFLPALGPDYLPEGGTDYQALLKTSLDAFASTNSADRFLIILSDGEAHEDNWQSSLAQLKEHHIRVISLGIGTALGAMIPDGSGGFVKDPRGAVVLSRLESGTLQKLAAETGAPTATPARGSISPRCSARPSRRAGRASLPTSACHAPPSASSGCSPPRCSASSSASGSNYPCARARAPSRSPAPHHARPRRF